MDKQIRALKRELAGRGKRDPASQDEILRELARLGVAGPRTPEQVEKRGPGRPKKPKAE